MSKIYIENIWMEDIFKWFYHHIIGEGGDGSSAIICENYREAADWFVEWVELEYDKVSLAPLWLDIYGNGINLHDNNENFIFTNNLNIKLFDYEYLFIIKEECISYRNKNRKLQPSHESTRT